jgi:hypothetical protein
MRERTYNRPMGHRRGWVIALACAASVALLSTMPFVGEAWAGEELIVDGSFEAGQLAGPWDESSDAYVTPICDTTACPDHPGTGPRTGDNWAWFGGIASETAVVAQDVTIPSGGATLSFWIEIPECSDDGGGTFTAEIDGAVVFQTDHNDPACGDLGYAAKAIDVSAYGDGGTHNVAFVGRFPDGEGVTSFFLDDVSLRANSPPTLALIGDKSAYQNQELSFTVSAVDEDVGDTLVYAADPLPPGATFDTATRAFSWTPSESTTPGAYDVEFSVTDGKATDSEEMTITVIETEPTTTTLTTFKKTSTKVKVTGTVAPPPVGQTVTVTLLRKRQGIFQPVRTTTPIVDGSGAFAAALRRTRAGSCMVQATYAGDADSGASSAAKTFRC